MSNNKSIGIVNYGAGNIFSLTAALDRIALPYGMVNTIADFDSHSHIIIPGVGHAGAAMDKLRHSGLVPAIKALTKPVLGICVGMQLLSEHSEEGNVDLLGLIPINTLHFAGRIELKVPHIGWNRALISRQHPLFDGIAPDAYFYFVHSYFLEYNENFTIAKTEYGTTFSAAIQQDNFIGVQFHPEKSGKEGEKLLSNFSKL
ncbi:imidazole glycerol phosphate synthase subunit HisH [Olivibacter sitiensis]|uniref:imidazole glycerol phosphate synthase subunit HisH n=1 Tax=Olivibacter sitiensis TaxID=376470 RepID=UPI0004262904|nr:imidazole glycerol phosphate synthase subunit HisH [Olivibacter sitiensis]